jgi:hypothetical protein
VLPRRNGLPEFGGARLRNPSRLAPETDGFSRRVAACCLGVRNRLDGPMLGIILRTLYKLGKLGRTGAEHWANRRRSLQSSRGQTPRSRSRMSVATSATRNTSLGRTLRTQSRRKGKTSRICRVEANRFWLVRSTSPMGRWRPLCRPLAQVVTRAALSSWLSTPSAPMGCRANFCLA